MRKWLRVLISCLDAVRHGARLERDERGALADRRRPRHDDPGYADGDRAVHARDGRVLLLGAKLGAILGRYRAFAIGLAIYGVGSLTLLWAFLAAEQRSARLGRDELLDTALLRISPLRAGLSTLVGQQFGLMGTFFVIRSTCRSCWGSTRWRPANGSCPVGGDVSSVGRASPCMPLGYRPLSF